MNPTGAYADAVALVVESLDCARPFSALAEAFDAMAQVVGAQAAMAPALAPQIEGSRSALTMLVVPILRELARQTGEEVKG